MPIQQSLCRPGTSVHHSYNASRLQQRLDEKFRQQVKAGIPVCSLFSLTLASPGFQIKKLPPLQAPYLYWARPDQDHWQLGLGEAWRTTARGRQRLEILSERRRQLEQSWQRDKRAAPPGAQPAVFCALAFAPDDPMTACWDGLPNSILFVPRLLLRTEAGQTNITFTCTGTELQDPDAALASWSGLIKQLSRAVSSSAQGDTKDDPDATRVTAQTDPAWTRTVQRAIGSIRNGQLKKVVAARRVRIEASRCLDTGSILARLARNYPSCLLVAVNLEGRTVVSATPERLASLGDRTIRCDALGGTTSRSSDARQDQKLALRLLECRKTQREHALVVESIHSALEPLCEELVRPNAPQVVKLRNLQHLWTGIEGRLRDGVSLLDAVRRLHPTPAVAGTPTDRACQWLQDHENLARGWYSGTAGWLQANGDGELSVLLRCAVLEGCSADLFAGAGIVAESDPQAELLETEIKLRAMLEAIQGSAAQEGISLVAAPTGQHVKPS